MGDRDAIDVREVMRMPGWKVIEGELEDMIKADEERLATIDVAGKSPEEIGGEYLTHRMHADGIRDALDTAHKYHER